MPKTHPKVIDLVAVTQGSTATFAPLSEVGADWIRTQYDDAPWCKGDGYVMADASEVPALILQARDSGIETMSVHRGSGEFRSQF